MLPNFSCGSKRSNSLTSKSHDGSRTDHLHQHTFSSQPVKFPVENLFPRTEVQPTFGDRDNHFSPHQLSLDMGVAVILSRLVMLIGGALRNERVQESVIVLE
jgi:hypothetical protein